MSEQLEILKLVTGRLDAAGVRYMVSGSTALNYYAQPRMTRDIDLVVELDAEVVGKVVALFEGDFYVDAGAAQEAVSRRSMFNLIHFEKLLKVDMIVRKDEPYRVEEFSRRRKFLIDGATMWVVAPEDLVLSKLVWAKETESEMQLLDVRNILTSAADLDRDYLLKWAHSLGVIHLLDRTMK